MRDWLDEWWPIALGITSIIVASVLAVLCVNHFANAADRRDCFKWSSATNNPVKFEDYGWGSWACLTPNPSRPGTWIDNDKLRSTD